nr:hypothetical protein [Tanacetum cinerariifolium]
MVAILEKSDAAEGFKQIIDSLSGSYINHALTVNPHIYILCIKQFWNTAVVKRLCDVTRLQALVDKKRIVIIEEVVREILQLNDAEGIHCLPNEEIFVGLARMRYEKPSTKLTFYKAFFSPQWKFFIHTILHSLSKKRTSWNEFSSAMASTVICLSSGQRFNFSNYIFESLVHNVDSSSKFYMVGKGFSRVETRLFESMLVVRDVAEEAEAQVPAQGDNVQEPATEEVVTEVVPPTPTPPSPPSHVLDTCSALARRVEGLENDKTAQQLEIVKLKARVKKLEKINMVKSSKPKRLKKVGTSQRVESSDDMENVFNQGRIIADMDQDKGIELVADQEKDAEAVATSTPIPAAKPKILNIAAAPAVSTKRRKRVYIKRYHEMKKKPQTESEARKNMIFYLKNTEGYKMDFFKGMKYDEIIPIFQAKFDANMRFLFKSREKIEEEDEEIIKSINETPAQKAIKRRKLHEQAKEDEDLKKQLEVVDDEDDDVFIKATPIGRKVPVVDYEIVMINNKPRYKIIKADGTHQLYISFITLLKNFNREDLEDLWRIVKARFSTSKPTNFFDDYLLSTLKTMFKKSNGQDTMWRNQNNVYGKALVKSWKLLTSCGLQVDEESEMYLELLRFTRQQLQEYQQG